MGARCDSIISVLARAQESLPILRTSKEANAVEKFIAGSARESKNVDDVTDSEASFCEEDLPINPRHVVAFVFLMIAIMLMTPIMTLTAWFVILMIATILMTPIMAP